MSLLAETFLNRLAEYGTKTGVSFHRTPRRAQWTPLGLPDLRGFAPHLRQINVYQDRPVSWAQFRSEDFITEFLNAPALQWIAHDLLHIAFYDFAALNLGVDVFENRNRFYEIHIASELFAVLALDYHCLVHTSTEGLAVDLSAEKWRAFQKSRDLPDVTSYAFCKSLSRLYLTGECDWASGEERERKKDDDFDLWLGHEIRYAEKQRYYVSAWRDDLELKKPTRKQVTVENSVVAEPLWELLSNFHFADDRTWKKYLAEVRDAVKKSTAKRHLFSRLPKFKKSAKKHDFDFRFTDVSSCSPGKIFDVVTAARRPSSAALFLFWQVLSLQSPGLWGASQRLSVERLALASQSSQTIDPSVWGAVRTLALGAAEKGRWKPDATGLGTFFLP